MLPELHAILHGRAPCVRQLVLLADLLFVPCNYLFFADKGSETADHDFPDLHDRLHVGVSADQRATAVSRDLRHVRKTRGGAHSLLRAVEGVHVGLPPPVLLRIVHGHRDRPDKVATEIKGTCRRRRQWG